MRWTELGGGIGSGHRRRVRLSAMSFRGVHDPEGTAAHDGVAPPEAAPRATPSPLNGERAGVRGVTDPTLLSRWRLSTPDQSSLEEERERGLGITLNRAAGRALSP